jgi:hypothetical protein
MGSVIKYVAQYQVLAGQPEPEPEPEAIAGTTTAAVSSATLARVTAFLDINFLNLFIDLTSFCLHELFIKAQTVFFPLQRT